MVSSRKKIEYITLSVGEERITSKQSIKYLGVMIDNRLTFKEQLAYIGKKCQEKRQLLLRLSTDAALVIAGLMSLQMLVEVRRRKYLIHRRTGLVHPDQLIDDLTNRWQNKWTSPRLILNIEVWMGKKHDQVNFYFSLLLTGHGCYGAYLYKYGHDIDETCPTCRNTSETAEHVFFICPRFEFQWNFLERTISTQGIPDNVVNVMLSSCENLNAICFFAKEALIQ